MVASMNGPDSLRPRFSLSVVGCSRFGNGECSLTLFDSITLRSTFSGDPLLDDMPRENQLPRIWSGNDTRRNFATTS